MKEMTNDINMEMIEDRQRFESFCVPERSFFKEAADNAVNTIRANLDTFTHSFPDAASENLVYSGKENKGWTQGFWAGMVWLAYELTGDERFRNVGDIHVDSFMNRIVNKIGTETHDLGFLYSLSAVAGYKVTGSEKAKECGLLAAKELLTRYRDSCGVIRSHGPVDGDMKELRAIIDCMLNLPLLYWAGKETGDEAYYTAALNSAVQTNNNHVRPDGSSFQVCIFDPVSGDRIRQETFQGDKDNSTWARGQAWGIYGFPLSYSYTEYEPFIHTSKSLINYFLNRLPSDDIAGWDLCYTGDNDQRDTSAASTAVCGMLELVKHLPDSDPDKVLYHKAAMKIMTSLIESYTTADEPNSNGLLKHGVYGFRQNAGVDECTIFGDYYYMEALVRVQEDWKRYW